VIVVYKFIYFNTIYREKMAQAYDFALDKMGLDISSFSLWNDYVKFLKGVEAAGSYAENQKITAIRKIYQRAVVNPMTNIEQLWYVNNTRERGILSDKKMMKRARRLFSVVHCTLYSTRFRLGTFEAFFRRL